MGLYGGKFDEVREFVLAEVLGFLSGVSNANNKAALNNRPPYLAEINAYKNTCLDCPLGQSRKRQLYKQ